MMTTGWHLRLRILLKNYASAGYYRNCCGSGLCLKGVYHIGRMEIGQCLLDFLAEVNTTEPDVLKLGIETFAKQNLDFPDCILYAYHMVKGYEVKTFDRKLIKLLAK